MYLVHATGVRTGEPSSCSSIPKHRFNCVLAKVQATRQKLESYYSRNLTIFSNRGFFDENNTTATKYSVVG